MKILYTAREVFDISTKEEDICCGGTGSCFLAGLSPWESYISWSRLYHVKELITLDVLLNRRIPELEDSRKKEYWDYIWTENGIITDLFTSLDHVLRMTKRTERFNLLAVAKEPLEDCIGVRLDGFEFVGYELLDPITGISALTNCGGFDETFLTTELNPFGLVDDFEKAYDINRRLLENNPDNPHAITNVMAVWRHRRVGRWRRYK
jgi:hypothetical protein